jgi:N-acetyl-alpha-D-muramate 1-phosphate uridylyltransferase
LLSKTGEQKSFYRNNLDFIKTKIVILSGGLATRLKPVSEKIAKSMIEISGKPFILHQIDLLKRNGINNVVICAGYCGKQIEDYIGDGANFGLSVKYSYDGDKLLGTGGAIKKALPLLTESFYVMYGDSYLNIEYKPIFEYFSLQQKAGLMTVFKNENQFDKSNIIFENGKILLYDKDSYTHDMKYIDYGLGILKKEAFQSFNTLDTFDLSQVYKKLVSDSNLLGYEVHSRFYEIGSFEGIRETEKYLSSLKHRKEN